MKDYTTGRAARELRISQNRLRILCQAGMIAARATSGGHFRIPKSEIDRLRREGVPDPPPATPTEPQVEPVSAPAANPRRHPVLLAEPSEKAIASADGVVQLENEVKAIGLKRAKEENLDWFRERQRKQDEAKATHARQVLDSKAQRLHREWENTWIEYAMEGVPDDAPEDARLPVYESVRQTLAGFNPSDTREVVEPLILAAVGRGLCPWRRSKEIEKATIEARNQLPYFAKGRSDPSEWELRAIRAASDGIRGLRDEATVEEIRTVAIAAGRRVASEYQHDEDCRRLVECTYLPHTPNEEETARQSVREALNKMPVGASRLQMEQARDQVLAPFKAAQEAARIQAQAANQADSYLRHVDYHLGRIAVDQHSPLNLGNFSDRYHLGQELKDEIRPILIEAILEEALSLDEARTFVESLVDHRILHERLSWRGS